MLFNLRVILRDLSSALDNCEDGSYYTKEEEDHCQGGEGNCHTASLAQSVPDEGKGVQELGIVDLLGLNYIIQGDQGAAQKVQTWQGESAVGINIEEDRQGLGLGEHETCGGINNNLEDV